MALPFFCGILCPRKVGTNVMSKPADLGGEIYIEFIPRGAYVKVSAICAATGFEVSIVGDVRASQSELENIAARKLRTVMKKNREKNAIPGSGFTV